MPKKKKSRSKTTEPELEQCQMDGCPNQEHPDGDGYCTLHAMLVDLTAESMEAARKAMRKGDLRTGLFQGLAGLFLSHSEPLMRATVAGAARRAARPEPQFQPPPPPPPKKPDPWAVLGLDPRVATEADVKRILKALSQLYHPDRKQTGVSAERMAEVNAAAAACLEQLRKRKQ